MHVIVYHLACNNTIQFQSNLVYLFLTNTCFTSIYVCTMYIVQIYRKIEILNSKTVMNENKEFYSNISKGYVQKFQNRIS